MDLPMYYDFGYTQLPLIWRCWGFESLASSDSRVTEGPVPQANESRRREATTN